MFGVGFAWRVFMALASLSVVTPSLDSLILDLEDIGSIDLTPLGTPNLDRYDFSYNVTVDENCNYILKVWFRKPDDEVVGAAEPDYQGVCSPTDNTGKADDGNAWHDHRRHWFQFPEYVERTTGFNHMALQWRPCGFSPKGYRQPRYDMNFYTVIPQYRVFWVCNEFKSPKVCVYNQTNPLGRSHFVVPRLYKDPSFLANMPAGFQPNKDEPEALQYEGLMQYGEEFVPETPQEWLLPWFQMSTYDGDTVSWRALLPYHYFSGPNSTQFEGEVFYVYQTMLRLPQSWNTTWNPTDGMISVSLHGSAGMCDGFEEAKQEFESAEERK